MDAITLLKDDHHTVAQLFTRFERAGDAAYETKRQIVERIIHELSVHAAIEELAFYPAVRREVKGAEDMALESLEEHHIVKWLLSELEGMDPRAERFDAKVTVLIENVRHHVEEEEGDLFPKVRDQMSRTHLAELGDRLAAAKKTVPTRPHPRSPDTPPGNLIAGAAAGLMDKATDAVKSAVTDTISKVTRSGDEVAEQISDTASGAKDTAREDGPQGDDLGEAHCSQVHRQGQADSQEGAVELHRQAHDQEGLGHREEVGHRHQAHRPQGVHHVSEEGPTSATRAAKRTAKKVTAGR